MSRVVRGRPGRLDHCLQWPFKNLLCSLVAARRRLPLVLRNGRGFQSGQDGLSGGLRLQCSPGDSLGGAHSSAGLVGQHLAVTGNLGIAGRNPRGSLRGPAVRAWVRFQTRPRLRC